MMTGKIRGESGDGEYKSSERATAADTRIELIWSVRLRGPARTYVISGHRQISTRQAMYKTHLDYL